MAPLLLLPLVIGVTFAFAWLGLELVRGVVRPRVGVGHNDVSSAIFSVGGTIYAVFLAFLVVTVWQSHDAASANVADEASLLTTLYRGSEAMEPASRDRLRALVRAYTRDVIVDEWPAQARNGGTSEKARSDALAMYKVFAVTSADAARGGDAVNAAQLALIAAIQSDRNKRTLQAQQSISPVIWSITLINGVLVILMSFFLYLDTLWPHLIMSSILATMVFTLIYVVFIFDRPFGGPLQLKPDAFVHSLGVYDSVDRMG